MYSGGGTGQPEAHRDAPGIQEPGGWIFALHGVFFAHGFQVHGGLHFGERGIGPDFQFEHDRSNIRRRRHEVAEEIEAMGRVLDGHLIEERVDGKGILGLDVGHERAKLVVQHVAEGRFHARGAEQLVRDLVDGVEELREDVGRGGCHN